MEDLIIIGTSTNARHVYEFIKYYKLFNVIGFAVDKEYKTIDTFMDLPVYEIETLKEKFDIRRIKFFIAIFWNRLNADRRDLYCRLKSEGYRFANVISPTAIIHGSIDGDNCWIHDYAVVNTDAHIGNDIMIMGRAFIGQDSTIYDHCFIGNGAVIASCSIGEQTFVGLNATVFDGVVVGKKCLIGATCAVKRNMPDYCMCKSNNDNTVVIQMTDDTIESKLLFRKNVR